MPHAQLATLMLVDQRDRCQPLGETGRITVPDFLDVFGIDAIDDWWRGRTRSNSSIGLGYGMPACEIVDSYQEDLFATLAITPGKMWCKD
jgi:hypothetical protein